MTPGYTHHCWPTNRYLVLLSVSLHTAATLGIKLLTHKSTPMEERNFCPLFFPKTSLMLHPLFCMCFLQAKPGIGDPLHCLWKSVYLETRYRKDNIIRDFFVKIVNFSKNNNIIKNTSGGCIGIMKVLYVIPLPVGSCLGKREQSNVPLT